ncbi:16S rRNA (cytidine(1402)-2'-O)-methyltransferase [Mycoplasmopsis lipofaciens]|uniref:16S rRNA (cytidine(1402)-2'-O)-methyltransferase n=1 Tax=Mycoplasmopsis lipofaciens TaxID=114884 RepID=UPI00047F5756|nr:16S rRNA (cytidine(1402)-2'-O)-methyltransferase [Mycoplasmopsis lipofaciens]
MSKIYIVGTPIGNLKDITFRAIETLKKVDFIACEDTRVTKKLLTFYKINKPLLTYNKDNEKNSAKGLIKKIIKNNIDIALVSDAGMPLISDPGFELIKEARSNDIQLELIPGVNAAISAMALSGLSNTFTFLGFPKEKSSQRKKQIEEFNEQNAYIFYVSPHKINNFLEDIYAIHSDNAEIFLARELTKLHEQHYRGSANEISKLLEEGSSKGEFTMVVKLKTIKKNKINKYEQFSKNKTERIC